MGAIKSKEQFSFPLRGGVDLVTPTSNISPGSMVDCINYEIGPSGGYTPIDGFERFDGQGLPSEAVFQYIITGGEFPGVGVDIVGVTSGATGTIIKKGRGADSGGFAILVHNTQHNPKYFQTGEVLTANGVEVGTAIDALLQDQAATDDEAGEYHWLAVETRRTRCIEVPGSGPLRGVWKFKDRVYAFRDNGGANACLMYEASSVGWSLVAGVPVLAPGGSYKFENNNFGVAANTTNMYGCDGKNDAFEYNGTTFTQIPGPNVVGLKPTFIRAHQNHLFLGYDNGQIYLSGVRAPLGEWSAIDGATRLGLGDSMTGWVSLPGGALGITCGDSIFILSGTSSEDWVLSPHTRETGAIVNTLQRGEATLFLNAAGIAELTATEAYGDFKDATVSTVIEPRLKNYIGNCINSVVIPNKNQYRLFFEDGFCITATVVGGKLMFTFSDYAIAVRTIAAPKRAEGTDVFNVYFGSDNGFVYSLDSGRSMDSKPMRGYFRLPYCNLRTPSVKKNFKGLTVELDALNPSDLFLRFVPDYTNTSNELPQHSIVDISETIGLDGGFWDISSWNMFSWVGSSGSGQGSGGAGTAEADFDGVSTDVSLLFYHEAPNTVAAKHTLNSVTIKYKYRGMRR